MKDSHVLSMTEFMQQYVLNRALTCKSELSGEGAAREAHAAWKCIKNAVKEDTE